MANFIFKNTQAEITGIKGIIFDKDGTLTNSNIFWSEIIKRRSLEIINFTKLDVSHFLICAKSWVLIWKVIYYYLKVLLH